MNVKKQPSPGHSRPSAKCILAWSNIHHFVRTDRRKQELVESDPLECWQSARGRRRRECSAQEGEPLELDWCHHETVCHEPGQSFKVERWRETRGFRDQVLLRPGDLAVQFVDLYGVKVVLRVGTARLAGCPLSYRSKRLGDSVRDSAEHLLCGSVISIPLVGHTLASLREATLEQGLGRCAGRRLTALVIMVVRTASRVSVASLSIVETLHSPGRRP